MAEGRQLIKVGVRELRGKLGDYLRRARNGSRFLIVSRGRPIAELTAPTTTEEQKPLRKLGLLDGKIRIEPDWDQWPEDVLQSFERPL